MKNLSYILVLFYTTICLAVRLDAQILVEDSNENIDSVSEDKPAMLLPETTLIVPQEGQLYYLADQFLPRISDQFYGALLVCNPYCDALAVKLSDNQWRPNLASIKVYSKEIKLLDVDDPLFKALFPEKKKEAEKISEQRKLDQEKKANQRKKINKKDEEPDPIPPKVPFVNGYRIGLDLNYNKITQSADSNVQSDFKPKDGLLNADLQFGFYRAKPIRLIKNWWQFEFEYDLNVYNSKANLNDTTSFDVKRNSMVITPWLMLNKLKLGIRYKTAKNDYTTSTNSLAAFSYSENYTSLGLGIIYQRWRLDFDYPIKYKVSDQQPYRDQFTKADFYDVAVQYCQTKKKLIGLRFIPCYKLRYLMSNTTAKLAPAYGASKSVSLNRSDIILSYIIYFGEDFYK